MEGSAAVPTTHVRGCALVAFQVVLGFMGTYFALGFLATRGGSDEEAPAHAAHAVAAEGGSDEIPSVMDASFESWIKVCTHVRCAALCFWSWTALSFVLAGAGQHGQMDFEPREELRLKSGFRLEPLPEAGACSLSPRESIITLHASGEHALAAVLGA